MSSHDHPHPEPLALDRRDFLRVGSAFAAATALTTAACRPPAETSLPFHERPEGLRSLGKPKHYATVSDSAPVLVRCREGRPILVVPNPAHPSRRLPTLRSFAALLDLYDPDRAVGPLSLRRGGTPVQSSWQAIGEKVAARLAAERDRVALLTGPLDGPATTALLTELAAALGLRHYTHAAVDEGAPARAFRLAFGSDHLPRPRLDRLGLLVGFGAELFDQPGDGHEREFGAARAPELGGRMLRFVQLEGRLSLSGANADERLRVRDSQLAAVALAIARYLLVDERRSLLAQDAQLVATLEPFTIAAVAARSGLDAARLARLGAELAAAGDRGYALGGGSASASSSGLALELALLIINTALGSLPGAVSFVAAPPAGAAGGLADLVAALGRGEIGTLLCAGVNPLYDATPTLDVAAALERAGLVVSLNDRIDETARAADDLAPLSHPFECWGDADLGDALAVQQPVLQPLYDTHGLLDVLVTWGAAAGAGGAIAAAAAPGAAGAEPTGPGYRYLRAHWQQAVLGGVSWDDVLRLGHHPRAPVEPPALRFDLACLPILAAADAPSPALELQLHPHQAIGDGRGANNGWLLELPDPITRLTWGNAVSIAPRRFDELALRDGDLVELTVGERTLTLPAYRHAGMHQDQLAVPLGFGRTAAGEIGNGVGHNAFTLQGQATDGRPLRAGLPVSLRRAAGQEPLAGGQGADVLDRARRPLVPFTTLSRYRKDPGAGTEQPKGGPSIYPPHTFPEQRWAMAIDLSRCNGCGKCVLGCQAENNVPVVGAETIRAGREMSWLRIDRYYDAPPRPGGWDDSVWDGPLAVVEEPRTLFAPMLCQHCENAPCETVCPFNATMHSQDGLNQQIYNRCVGTRYCANNCPFKVRRYNWYEYAKAQTNRLFTLFLPILERHAALNVRGRLQMKNNPEVTVRSRGVMEKCSFCVQRIREARAAALRDGHPGKLADGAVVPACMEACPTGAIVFGDLNDPTSRVHALAHDPRAMRLLEALGVGPAVYYLTKVRHDLA